MCVCLCVCCWDILDLRCNYRISDFRLLCSAFVPQPQFWPLEPGIRSATDCGRPTVVVSISLGRLKVIYYDMLFRSHFKNLIGHFRLQAGVRFGRLRSPFLLLLLFFLFCSWLCGNIACACVIFCKGSMSVCVCTGCEFLREFKWTHTRKQQVMGSTVEYVRKDCVKNLCNPSLSSRSLPLLLFCHYPYNSLM